MKNQKPSSGSSNPHAQDVAPATPVNPVINGTLVNLALIGESFYVDGDIIRDKNGEEIANICVKQGWTYTDRLQIRIWDDKRGV